MFLPLSSPPTGASQPSEHPESFFHCNRAISLISPSKRALSPIQPTSFDDNISSNSTPTAILPFLYLGSVKDARNRSFLKTQNINYVINCSCDHRKSFMSTFQKGMQNKISLSTTAIDDSEDAFDEVENVNCFHRDATSKYSLVDMERRRTVEQSLVDYSSSPLRNTEDVLNDSSSYFETLNIPALDSPQQDLKQYFIQAINFIEKSRRSNSSVLVHCGAGISRSATIVVAYLMWYLQLPFMASYKFVQKLRPQISPNLNFVGQLVAFGKDLPDVGNDWKGENDSMLTRKRCWSEKAESDCVIPQRKKQGHTSVYSSDIISF